MIVICDDDQEYIDCIKDIIVCFYTDENRSVELELFTNPIDMIEYINKNEVDLIFLDIMMPEISGFKIAEENIQKSMRMVNISNEKSVQSYTAHCSRYKNKYTNLICGKTAVGRNYNLPHDNQVIWILFL
ncbi:MAG: response regulator [Lachnospira sp.]|nr:response regulator [Lachnospira sp.]